MLALALVISSVALLGRALLGSRSRRTLSKRRGTGHGSITHVGLGSARVIPSFFCSEMLRLATVPFGTACFRIDLCSLPADTHTMPAIKQAVSGDQARKRAHPEAIRAICPAVPDAHPSRAFLGGV